MKTYACRTRRGSLYVVARDDDGGFWLTADNRPNQIVGKLPGDVAWPVTLHSAWPPVAGKHVHLRVERRVVDGEPVLPHERLETSSIVEVIECPQELTEGLA